MSEPQSRAGVLEKLYGLLPGRRTLTLQVLCVLMLFGGCAAGPIFKPPAEGSGVWLIAQADEGNGADDLPDILRELGLELRYREGAMRDRAGRTLDEVIEGLERPDYLPQPGVEVETSEAQEPPTAAIRAYTRGRDAYQRGDRFEAINQLEQAARLDPGSAHVLRVLGEAYLSRGDQVRGTQRLEKAAKLDPEDPAVLFLLGRQSFRRSEWDRAIVTLAYTRQLLERRPELLNDEDRVDPAIEHLLPYYLGLALLQRGYDRAAVATLDDLLSATVTFDRSSELLRELALLSRRLNDLNVLAGDAMMRLGETDAAYERYLGVERPVSDDDAAALVARRIYALLELGREEDAELEMWAGLAEGEPNDRMLGLLGYLAERVNDREGLVERLEGLYEDRGRPTSLALAVARMEPEGRASEFLLEHLSAKPDDMAAYRAALRSLSGHPLSEAVTLSLRLMGANPHLAGRYAEGLLDEELGFGEEPLLAAVEAMGEAERETAAWHFLRGVMFESLGRMEEAAESYDLALQTDDGFVGSRMAVIDLHLNGGRFERALELIEGTEEPHSLEMRFAKSKALMGLRRLDDAEVELRGLLAELPQNGEYVLQLAELELMRGDLARAESTLWSVIDADGLYEPAYVALFRLYRLEPDRFSDAARQRLLQRSQLNIPDSRTARFELARWYIDNGRVRQAEPLLRALISRDDSDGEAMVTLVGVLNRTGRSAEAFTLLEGVVEDQRDNLSALLLYGLMANEVPGDAAAIAKERFDDLADAYESRQLSTVQEWLALSEQYLRFNLVNRAAGALDRALRIDDATTAQLLGDMDEVRGRIVPLLMMGDRDDAALEHLEHAIELHPESAADYHYQRGRVFMNQGRNSDYMAAMEAAIAADPNHPGANNDLGYNLVEEHRDLERALGMIRKAVAAEPDNAAYLDSLGWALYKMGELAEAATQLQKAANLPSGQDPVIQDHLGDVLWRLGMTTEAVERWQAVQQSVAGAAAGEGLAGELAASVVAKIRAVRGEAKPPVAPILSELEGAEGEDGGSARVGVPVGPATP